ncbi:MAG: ATP-binding protein [Candidatus Margulisbacteria bacterium]|nr:ATP-binding protein [Candidatus Margulisiibacteriota bacterium]
MEKRGLPIGIQTFEGMIRGNYTYVDKTQHLYNLVNVQSDDPTVQGGRYFLSRPRRFGKSLLISTMEAIFKGKRELFKGLWIDKSDYSWDIYPVVRLDMSSASSSDPEKLNLLLNIQLNNIAKEHAIHLDSELPPQVNLMTLIKELSSTVGHVVVLIDEYDKPIIDQLNNTEVAKQNREILKDFYGVLKAQDEHIRFVFLTGVSKFSKVSIFSGLNNLNDITMDTKYATLLGYTQEELEHFFEGWISELGESMKMDKQTILNKIKKWYNGYQFSKADEAVYNPFSTLLLFDKKDFLTHWFETGTPTFLIDLLKQKEYAVPDIENSGVSIKAFSSFEVDNLQVLPLLYQTGYLTIKQYDPESRLYTLRYPNEEVTYAFTESLLESFAHTPTGLTDSYAWQLIQALRADDLNEFFKVMKVFFANVPYDLKAGEEKYFQSIFYLILKLMGVKIDVEVHTNDGRIDGVVETEGKIYIIEFKLNMPAKNGLDQIKEKKYYEKYLLRKDKSIILVGVSFDSKTRTILEWETLPLNPPESP